MSNCCAIGFQLDHQIKATYAHWKSHPTQNGKYISEFLAKLSEKRLSRLEERANSICWVSIDDKPSSDDIKRYQSFAGHGSVVPGRLDDWYFLLYKTQGVAGLIYLLSGQLDHFIDNAKFLKDSLQCEWGYILNFDTHKLDVYQGCQIEADPNNPLGQEVAHTFEGKNFYPCKCVFQLNLSDPMSHPEWAKLTHE